jgi:hypothetical protein
MQFIVSFDCFSSLAADAEKEMHFCRILFLQNGSASHGGENLWHQFTGFLVRREESYRTLESCGVANVSHEVQLRASYD